MFMLLCYLVPVTPSFVWRRRDDLLGGRRSGVHFRAYTVPGGGSAPAQFADYRHGDGQGGVAASRSAAGGSASVASIAPFWKELELVSGGL
jgi:hypothetical protein